MKIHTKKTLLALFLIYFVCIETRGQEVYIIIHGTWACGTNWSNPGGDFFDALETCVLKYGKKVIPYTWSGKNDHSSREHAASGLVKVIQSYPPETIITVIAHSHGANVGIVASQKMARDKNNTHIITYFYALGVPVNVSSYHPDMNVITYFYNLFSFEDFVQSVFGIFERTYPKHLRIANLRLFVNGKEPGHSELHDPLLACFLPKLHTFIIEQEKTGSDISTPGIIYLAHNQAPRYQIDHEREHLIERDREINLMMLTMFARSYNNKNPI